MKIHQKRLLDRGKIEKLVGKLRLIKRMRYPMFRRQYLFIGSGVIGSWKAVVASRLKMSGMFWTVRGANAILALRCCHLKV